MESHTDTSRFVLSLSWSRREEYLTVDWFSNFQRLWPHEQELRDLTVLHRTKYVSSSSSYWVFTTRTSDSRRKLSVVFSGESAVGKSSLVLRFVKGQFHEYQESTIGGRKENGKFLEMSLISMRLNTFSSAAFLTQTVCLEDTTVKFEIWDTAGQENILLKWKRLFLFV